MLATNDGIEQTANVDVVEPTNGNTELHISFDSKVAKRSFMESPNGGSSDHVRVVSGSGISNLSSRYTGTTEEVHTTSNRTQSDIVDVRGLQSSIRSNKKPVITSEHIIKIFARDNEITEVTQEELERVKIIHRQIEEMAIPSFNYNTMIFVAAVLAGLGLVSNSVATITASMLVSPIMGPVIGLAYGMSIGDWQLVRISLKSELLSLLFCVVAGMVIGAITGPTVLSSDWPTPEMANRGTYANLVVGCPVAFFSGIGVAVSLLDDQASSLVGVAISASLLPPAVNCGILLVAFAFITTDSGTLQGYDEYTDYGEAALISLLLTVANIVLIIVSSMIMFRVKEVLPIKKKIFWSDLGIARKVYEQKAVIRRDDVTVNMSTRLQSVEN